VAFARWTSESTQTAWWVRPDGSGLEQISAEGGVITWSPNSMLLAAGDGIFRAGPTGDRVATWADAVNGGARPVDWRAGTPQLAFVASTGTNGGEQRLEILDVGSTARVVARETASLTQATFRDPRWQPGNSSVLFVRAGALRSEVRVLDTQTSTQRLVDAAGAVRRAEWNPAGSRVLYITTLDGRDELRFTPRIDGTATNEGALLSTSGRPRAVIADFACVVLH